MEELILNSINDVKKGKIIYSIGEKMSGISIIESGRVLVFDAGTKIVCGPGNVLGISNLNDENYSLNHVSLEDAKIYTLNINNSEELGDFLNENPEYRYKIIEGITGGILELYKTYCEYEKMASGLKAFMVNSYHMLNVFAKNCGVTVPKLDVIEKMPMVELDDITYKTEYYISLNNMEGRIRKEYFSNNNIIACHHIDEQIEIVNILFKECDKLNLYLQKLAKGLIDKDECLMATAAQLLVDARKLKHNDEIPLNMFKKIKKKCEELDNLFANRSGRKLNILRERIEQITDLFRDEIEASMLIEAKDRSAKTTVKYAGTDIEIINKEVDKTFEKLMEYGELEEADKLEFRKQMVCFIKLKDKQSTDGEVRKLRQMLSQNFYKLYEKIFLKRCEDDEENRIVDLFLIYGLLDERLLSKDQIVELYCHDEQYDEMDGCRVYNAKQWLEAIYNGEKEPSKNEFDLDYQEYLREKKKTKEITDEQYKEEIDDTTKKVSYEIHNMFRLTSRMVSGQAGIFVPFIYKENFMGHLDKSIMPAEQVNALITSISNIDYSLFYRERMISEPEHRIDKEYVQEEYLPDIVLVPVYGNNVIMWQDIEGRKRSTHGRFVFPIFSEVDMEDSAIKACGRFRWELCKTIQGANWNNLQIKSLTSEYADYIQFYKKNHSLSDDKKEKIKMQIQKGRGNTKEIFVIDYLAWIKSESSGAMRLNKVAREILATYCPFNADIRKKLVAQPLFEEAMGRYQHQKALKVREVNNRYQSYKNKGIELLPSMEKTLEFYSRM